jgi:hypothetical protein
MEYLSVEVLNYSKLFAKVYGKGGSPIDPTIFDRLRYFSHYDFGWSQEELKPFYTVLTLDNEHVKDKIIGIVKCAYYKDEATHEKNYGISFFSIDMQYRNLGYSRLMADKLFHYASINGIEFNPSSYSYLGKIKLQKIMLEYASKYNVVYNDKKDTDHLNDCGHVYDENFNHVNERSRFDFLCSQGVELKLTKHPEYVEPIEKKPVRMSAKQTMKMIANRFKKFAFINDKN